MRTGEAVPDRRIWRVTRLPGGVLGVTDPADAAGDALYVLFAATGSPMYLGSTGAARWPSDPAELDALLTRIRAAAIGGTEERNR